MAETDSRTSPLRDVIVTEQRGKPGAEPGVTLCERRDLAIVQLRVRGQTLCALPGKPGLQLPAEVGAATECDGLVALWTGPGCWLLVASGRDGEAWERELGEALAGQGAALNDLSHGRCVIRIAGSAARDVLAAGCALDTDACAFHAGSCRATNLGPFAVVIHALGSADGFDVYLMRSFAQSAWEWLLEAAAEYGCRVEPV